MPKADHLLEQKATIWAKKALSDVLSERYAEHVGIFLPMYIPDMATCFHFPSTNSLFMGLENTRARQSVAIAQMWQTVTETISHGGFFLCGWTELLYRYFMLEN